MPTTPRPASAADRRLVRGAAVVSLVAMAACAQVPAEPEARLAHEQTNDPAEPANRVVFAGNQWVDRNALQPVARAYDEYAPDRVRVSLRNFSGNLRAPTTLVNDVLQANFDRAWVTTQRFVVNTTLGGAGLFDVATDWDLPAHRADFGQTFGVWGVAPGRPCSCRCWARPTCATPPGTWSASSPIRSASCRAAPSRRPSWPAPASASSTSARGSCP